MGRGGFSKGRVGPEWGTAVAWAGGLEPGDTGRWRWPGVRSFEAGLRGPVGGDSGGRRYGVGPSETVGVPRRGLGWPA